MTYGRRQVRPSLYQGQHSLDALSTDPTWLAHLELVLGRELTESWKSLKAGPVLDLGFLLSLKTKPLQVPLGREVPDCRKVKTRRPASVLGPAVYEG
jgi:hypothetical protein